MNDKHTVSMFQTPTIIFLSHQCLNLRKTKHTEKQSKRKQQDQFSELQDVSPPDEEDSLLSFFISSYAHSSPWQ